MMLDEQFGFDARAEQERVVFVGDSPNDEPMFAFFSNAVGVANCFRFAGELKAAPRWVTRKEGARGFAELADHLIAGRSTSAQPRSPAAVRSLRHL
jgi:hydroxymethylpyrimidine pyrophosphatase-like HAD family hydrolase